MRHEKPSIAFDCDGTLIGYDEFPRLEIVKMLEEYQDKGYRVIVWSGGGQWYARTVGERLKLQNVAYFSKSNLGFKPDIAVDDMEVNLGIKNIKV